MTSGDAVRSKGASIRDAVLAVTIVAGAAFGLWRYSGPSAASEDLGLREMDVPVTLDSRLMLGQASAPAVIVVASDFQCPFCAMFGTETLPAMRSEFIEPGRVSIYFRHFIGPTHQFAAKAAAFAECAARTGDFWRVHDQLFAVQSFLEASVISNMEAKLAATDARYQPCPDAPAVVREDNRWALQMGATGSPYFFLGKRQADGKVLLKYAFSGARPIGDFRKAIARLLD